MGQGDQTLDTGAHLANLAKKRWTTKDVPLFFNYFMPLLFLAFSSSKNLGLTRGISKANILELEHVDFAVDHISSFPCMLLMHLSTLIKHSQKAKVCEQTSGCHNILLACCFNDMKRNWMQPHQVWLCCDV